MRSAAAFRAVLLVLLVGLAGCMASPGGDAGEDVPPAADRGSGPSYPVDAGLSASGRWLEPFDGEVPAVNMVLLKDGRILYWSGVEAPHDGGPMDQVFFTDHPLIGESRILTLTSDGFHITEPINKLGDGHDLFCSGQTILPDGRVLAAGGSDWNTLPAETDLFLDGTRDARIFDPSNDTWYRIAEMDLGRWYPSVFTAPDGKAIAASGIGNLATFSEQWPNWEVYTEAQGSARDSWSIMPGTDGHLLPLYPRLHLLPGGDMAGHAFYSTAGTLWGPFGEHPQQPEWSNFQSYDLEHDAWHTHGLSQFGSRQYASSVMLAASPDDGYRPTIVSFGGTMQQSIVATAFTEIIDASGAAPVTRQGPDMLNPRWNHNSVLLPDGDVLTIGGGLYDNVVIHGQQNIPVLEAEVFDPDTETWREVAAMEVPRMYHSTALLLPDGRILVGGHVPLPFPDQTGRDTIQPQIVETRLEIYEPGYLFRGERPSITAAPETVHYGQTFEIQLAFNGTIDSVMLMRPGSTTHAYDANQRGIYLEVVGQRDGVLAVQAPPSAIVSQPGPHMLFVNGAHEDGAVPSVAAWVDVGV